jgi:hypothetical protein
VEPDDSPVVFHDTAVFVFRIEDGKLAGCSAEYLDFDDHKEFGARESAH